MVLEEAEKKVWEVWMKQLKELQYFVVLIQLQEIVACNPLAFGTQECVWSKLKIKECYHLWPAQQKPIHTWGESWNIAGNSVLAGNGTSGGPLS